MDWLTFFSKAIEALAWPVVVGFVLLSIKEELITLVPSLKSLKAGPLEAEFDKQVEKVAEVVSEIAPPPIAQEPALPVQKPGKTKPPPSWDGERQIGTPITRYAFENKIRLAGELDEQRTSARIFESWKGIEDLLLTLMSRYELKGKSIPQGIDGLETLKVISKDVTTALRKLYILKNTVARTEGFEPDPEVANSYWRSADKVHGALYAIMLGAYGVTTP